MRQTATHPKSLLQLQPRRQEKFILIETSSFLALASPSPDLIPRSRDTLLFQYCSLHSFLALPPLPLLQEVYHGFTCSKQLAT